MAEEQYVTYDKYRADLADFRADMANFREEVRGSLSNIDVKLAELEVRLVRWLLVAAAIGGLIGGLIAVVSKLLA